MTDDQVDVGLECFAEHTALIEPASGDVDRWVRQAASLGEQRLQFRTFRAMLLVAATLALLAYGWAQRQLHLTLDATSLDGGSM